MLSKLKSCLANCLYALKRPREWREYRRSRRQPVNLQFGSEQSIAQAEPVSEEISNRPTASGQVDVKKNCSGVQQGQGYFGGGNPHDRLLNVNSDLRVVNPDCTSDHSSQESTTGSPPPISGSPSQWYYASDNRSSRSSSPSQGPDTMSRNRTPDPDLDSGSSSPMPSTSQRPSPPSDNVLGGSVPVQSPTRNQRSNSRTSRPSQRQPERKLRRSHISIDQRHRVQTSHPGATPGRSNNSDNHIQVSDTQVGSSSDVVSNGRSSLLSLTSDGSSETDIPNAIADLVPANVSPGFMHPILEYGVRTQRDKSRSRSARRGYRR
ncbi:hypothetical protein BDV18DRAFT_141945 [Aspergillus unguis]